MAKPLRQIAQQERYGQSLLVLVVVYLLADFGDWMARVADFALIAILLMITLHPLVPKKLRIVSIAAAALSAMFSLTRVISETPTTIGIAALTSMLVIVITVVAILIRLLSHTEVTTSTVMGAFLGYALVGVGAAYLYIAVDAFSSEPFFAQGPQPQSAYTYFSLVTLTTVGFGDLTAGTDLAQRLVVIEALAGQVFLVVLVARLVSLWAPPRRITKTEPDAE